MFYCTEVTQMLRVGVVEAAGFSTGPGQSEWRFVHGAPTGSICIALPGHSLNMQIHSWGLGPVCVHTELLGSSGLTRFICSL